MSAQLKNLVPPAAADRLLHYRQVNELIGSTCKTGHTARALAARGLIRAVKFNARVTRYSESSVLALIAGSGGNQAPAQGVAA